MQTLIKTKVTNQTKMIINEKSIMTGIEAGIENKRIKELKILKCKAAIKIEELKTTIHLF